MPVASAEAPAAAASILDLYAATEAVVGQIPARQHLATLLRRQLMVAEGNLFETTGALLCGPTGSGKTMMLRLMCRACGLPFATQNATQFTDKGYVGKDLSHMYLPLLRDAARIVKERHAAHGGGLAMAGGPLKKRRPAEVEEIVALAESGVLLLDEIDKWCHDTGGGDGGRSIGRKLQFELLQMIEGDEVNVSEDDDDPVGIEFDTTRVLHIGAGAFVGIDRMVGRRVVRDGLADHEPEVLAEFFSPLDFIAFGMTPELCGRMSTIIALKPLKEDSLIEIVKASGLLEEYRARFEAEGAELVYTEEGLRALAAIALGRGTGARGLRHAFEGCFKRALFAAAKKGGRGFVRLDVHAAQFGAEVE